MWLDEAGVPSAVELPPRVDVLRSAGDDPRLCKVGRHGKPWLSAGPATAATCPRRMLAWPLLDGASIVLSEVEQQLGGSWSGGRFLIVDLGEGAGAALGPRVPADVETGVGEAIDEIAAGASPFVGPLYDSDGNEQVPEGESLTEEFLASGWTWLLGGVLAG